MKFVVILNKRHDLGAMASALGHVVAGVTSTIDRREGCFVTYKDADGESYPNISEWPLIVLRASSAQMKSSRKKLINAELPSACYLNTMFSGGSIAQQAATAKTKSEEVELIALATFGGSELVDAICKKHSLWR